MYTTVLKSDLNKFDNWSGSFWNKFEKEIQEVSTLNRFELISLISDKNTTIKDIVGKMLTKVIKDNREFSESIPGNIKKLTTLSEDQISTFLNNLSLEYLRQMAVLMLFLEENVFSQTYDELKNELHLILEKLNNIELNTGRPRTNVS